MQKLFLVLCVLWSGQIYANPEFAYGGMLVNKSNGERIAAICKSVANTGELTGKCEKFNFYKLPSSEFPSELWVTNEFISLGTNVSNSRLQEYFMRFSVDEKEIIGFLISRDKMSQELNIKNDLFKIIAERLDLLSENNILGQVGLRYGTYQSKDSVLEFKSSGGKIYALLNPRKIKECINNNWQTVSKEGSELRLVRPSDNCFNSKTIHILPFSHNDCVGLSNHWTGTLCYKK